MTACIQAYFHIHPEKKKAHLQNERHTNQLGVENLHTNFSTSAISLASTEQKGNSTVVLYTWCSQKVWYIYIFLNIHVLPFMKWPCAHYIYILCILSKANKTKTCPGSGCNNFLAQVACHMEWMQTVTPREVGISAIPVLTCSKWEFLNWAPIPECPKSAAWFWNWLCGWSENGGGNVTLFLYIRRKQLSVITTNVEVWFYFSNWCTLDQAFGGKLKQRAAVCVTASWPCSAVWISLDQCGECLSKTVQFCAISFG